MYSVPKEYQVRLHHVRPRFKGNIEAVLIDFVNELVTIPELPRRDFCKAARDAIRSLPGNENLKDKTIANKQTEISSLFGLIEFKDNNLEYSRRAKELADSQDLVWFFKQFLFSFQYPGAHSRTDKISEQISLGVSFQPAKYILSMLYEAGKGKRKRPGVSKSEVCWCLFNDLRVVRDKEPVLNAWQRITDNRSSGIKYNNKSDKTRYAGDILDYMVIANLLERKSGNYYLNYQEKKAIKIFIESSKWFTGYDQLISKREGIITEIRDVHDAWFAHVNRKLDIKDFKTDVLTYIAGSSAEGENLAVSAKRALNQLRKSGKCLKTKIIGDNGELLIKSHECERMRLGARNDLLNQIEIYQNVEKKGYDIRSFDLSGEERHIEVKTTTSSETIGFRSFNLTPNEWNTADAERKIYFVYRLMVSKKEQKLYIIQNPIEKYKKDTKIIEMKLHGNGNVSISFNPKEAGNYEKLLFWKNSE